MVEEGGGRLGFAGWRREEGEVGGGMLRLDCERRKARRESTNGSARHCQAAGSLMRR